MGLSYSTLLTRFTSSIAGFQPQRMRMLLLAAAALVTLGVSFVFNAGLHSFEEQTAALSWRLNPAERPEDRISIISIDERSIAELGPFPWSRDTMAQLAEALNAAGVQMQVYDVLFSEAREGDEAFIAALANTKAVIAQTPTLEPDQTTRTGLLTHPLSGVSCERSANVGSGHLGAHPAFANIPKGNITALVASDGAIREVPAYICIDGQAYPHMALSSLLMLTGAESWSVSIEPGTSLFGPEQVLRIDSYPGLEIPLDAAGNLRVSFRNDPGVYRYFPAVDIINGTIPRDLLENTAVIVGTTAFGLDDIVPTPYSGAAAGVEFHARILGSLLDDTVPYTPKGASLYRALLSLVFAGLLFWVASAKERVSGYALAMVGVFAPAFAWLMHTVLLDGYSVWVGWLFPALYAMSGAVMLILYEYARVRLERSRVLNNLSSYLPGDMAHEIAYTLPNSSIAARRQDVTLLSADLRNFSAYGEARPPEEAAALLHYFFVRTTDIIEKHGGTVHEFKGDSLLAVWNASDEAAAASALAAALDMQRTIQDVLPQHPPAGLEPLALGIG
ncbi:MAG: adenylate/guanylate cyclase domain-containing protein, partial [Pseudomonadota bacterium]|nr:adenylate/guanylate cyclase domain-containing protein [Pseudomonadota bacterium]